MDSACKVPNVCFDSIQTRRFYLVGSVPFPPPFPTMGSITVQQGCTQRDSRVEPREQEYVVLREKASLEYAVTRIISSLHVAAIFFAGEWVEVDGECKFRFSQQNCASDLEQGEWFLGPIAAEEINKRLCVDISSPETGARGIVFVPENRPVLTSTESTNTAAVASDLCTDSLRCESFRSLMHGCEQR